MNNHNLNHSIRDISNTPFIRYREFILLYAILQEWCRECVTIYPLNELLKGLTYSVIGNFSLCRMSRIVNFSKQVKEGDIFISEKNNRRILDEAIQLGAIAVVSDVFIADCSIPQVIIPSEMERLKERIGKKTYELYGKKVKTVAITGTNGKTTVAFFVGQLLMQQRKSVCVIGTLGVFINGQRLEQNFRNNTTLPFYDFIQIVHYCYEHSIEFIILEASSQGLLDNRLGNYPIDIGVFLNIGKDHLEFHGGMVPYKKSKELLVPLCTKLVVNADDEWCRTVAQNSFLPIISFGLDARNTVVFQQKNDNEDEIMYKFKVKNEEIEVQMRNSGFYNGMNLAAALASLWALNIPVQNIKPLSLPTGRFQHVDNDKGIKVLIDYAHTPDALEACLSTIKSFAKKNIYVVFGCGGNRDKKKRNEMGKVATAFATQAIITSDNPRNENPLDIIKEIVRGLDNKKFRIESDRKQAIIYALQMAEAGDIVLIAGKGHEQEQILHDLVVPFSDRDVVNAYFAEEGGLITKNDPVA
ncbi:UDP-N-acetylmuramoyl-L-alanyl-D-glutamate--2,6-diaminopimelate ligase [Psychrobacillus sp. INOP01]|nr:UDP-N-acetylmuramoyl-L-alanyl-D-glutamate--2,6-diaminopimelate ligase [Psychrobacillus sp. INOP01]